MNHDLEFSIAVSKIPSADHFYMFHCTRDRYSHLIFESFAAGLHRAMQKLRVVIMTASITKKPM